MNSDNREIINAISELKQEVAVLKEKNEHLEAYIFKDLRPNMEKLFVRIDKCVNKSIEQRQSDLKWAVALTISLCISFVGWALVLIR